MNVIRRILPVIGLLVTLAALMQGCAQRESDDVSEEEAVPRAPGSEYVTLTHEALENLDLGYARAEERELDPSLNVTAELMPNPDRWAQVSPRVPGRIVEVHVNVGDRVTNGAPLAELESQDVGNARAELIAARARADVAKRTYERKKGLYEARVTSQQELEAAAGALETANADMAAVMTRLHTAGIMPGEDESETNPARVTLRSPLDGVVSARSAHVGRLVEPAETLFEIVNLNELWLMLSVYERDMRFLHRGQTVHAEVRAYPGEMFTGTVEQIGDVLDPRSRTVKVRVVLSNPSHRLKPGMFADVHITGAHAHEPQPLLAIPWEAVQEVDGHHVVFVRREERTFELRRIHTGERAGSLVEVLNGIAIGDEVVTDGSFLLKGELLKATLGEEE